MTAAVLEWKSGSAELAAAHLFCFYQAVGALKRKRGKRKGEFVVSVVQSVPSW